MRKYLLHILIISFVFILAPTASYAGEDETWWIKSCKEEVRKNPDDAKAHYSLGLTYFLLMDRGLCLRAV
jgi:hypothetical protein